MAGQRTIIHRFFPDAVPLHDYVKETFDIDIGTPTADDELCLSTEERKSLHTTLVGVSNDREAVPVFSNNYAPVTIREAVHSAQVRITSNAGTFWEGQKNTLTKGYARPEENHEAFQLTHTGKAGLINRFPNSMVTRLVMDKQYRYLFSKIGPDRFTWLLANTSIFVPIAGQQADRTCFVQLTGRALTEARIDNVLSPVQPSDAASDMADGKRKRKRKTKADYKGTAQDAVPLAARALEGSRRPSKQVRTSLKAKPDAKAADLSLRKIVSEDSVNIVRKLSEISIVRSRIFYARASRNLKGEIELGLPAIHVFNRSASEAELAKSLPTYNPKALRSNITTARPKKDDTSRKKKEKIVTVEKKPDQTFAAQRLRHLAKYVFPRQYNLHNVFTAPRDYKTTTHLFRDYTVRETEIRERGSKPTPKRVKPALSILAKIIARHERLDYKTLLNRCCPTRLPKRQLTDQEKVQIVQDLAEAHKKDQADGSNVAIVPKLEFPSDEPEPDIDVRKPRYTNYAIESVGQIVHFVTLVIKSLLPRDLFGSAHNQRLVLSWVGRFVRLRRFETFTLHQIFQNFRMSDVEWTVPAAEKQQRPTASESLKRQEVVLEVLYWIMDSLVVPLLRTCFYVTESAAYRNRTLYFRQDDWESISKPVLLHLKQTIFEPLSRASAVQIMANRQLGYSHVRLLPKETGVRPIVNLRRRSTKQRQAANHYPTFNKRSKFSTKALAVSKGQAHSAGLGRSINQILQSTFHILTYEKNRLIAQSRYAGEEDDNMLSSAVFGQNDIYRHLKRYKHQIGLGSSQLSQRPLYFVKVDVRCAFDSIDQGKLLEILEQILSHQGNSYDGYRVHRYAKVMAGKVARTDKAATATALPAMKRKFASLAQPDSAHLDFGELATSLATALHDTVFVDNVAFTYEDSAFVLTLLRDHVTSNLIKIGKEYYRQKVGIPQGSSLSTLLCNFFYADMEAHSPQMKFLKEKGKEGLLLRYTDDFLYVTRSKTQAKKFLSVMQEGHPTYGCFISKDKTLVNFDLVNVKAEPTEDPLVPKVPNTSFPWCGMTIDTKTLGVETDLRRYTGVDMRDTLTVEAGRRPGQIMVEKLLQSIKMRCHILFTDTALNGEARVYSGIYTGFVIAALKFVAYLGELRRFKIVFRAKYLFKAVTKLVQFTGRYIASQAAMAQAKLNAEKRQLGLVGSKTKQVGWKVNCAVRAAFVHWLGYAAFLAVIDAHPKAGATQSDESCRRRSAIDRTTRIELISLLTAPVYRRSHARKRMLSLAHRSLSTARDVLDF